MFKANIKFYVKKCNICLILKSVRHKAYNNLQSLLVPTHQYRNLSMNFITRLLVSTNRKGKTYNSILVIINKIKKRVYYELIKGIINFFDLTKVIINIVVRHHGLFNSIVTDCSLVFISKFQSLFYYFLEIKQKLFTTFYL